MLEKGFLNEKSRRKTVKKRNASFISRLMLFVGAVAILIGIMNILVNMHKPDGMLKIWSVLIVAGVILVFISLMVTRFRKKEQ